jgi:hypothetical protein
MQWHWQEEMGARELFGSKAARKTLGHGEPAAVLERLHQPVARKLVAP